MKLFDRFILALYSLILIVVSIIVMAVSLQVFPYQTLERVISSIYEYREVQLAYLIVSFIILLMSLRFFVYGYKRQKKTPSIVQPGELGDVRISLDTIESIALKASRRVSGIREIRAKVEPSDNGTMIHVKATVDGQTPIPQLSDELQKHIKHDIQEIAGIHVEKVTVMISDVNKTQAARARVE